MARQQARGDAAQRADARIRHGIDHGGFSARRGPRGNATVEQQRAISKELKFLNECVPRTLKVRSLTDAAEFLLSSHGIEEKLLVAQGKADDGLDRLPAEIRGAVHVACWLIARRASNTARAWYRSEPWHKILWSARRTSPYTATEAATFDDRETEAENAKFIHDAVALLNRRRHALDYKAMSLAQQRGGARYADDSMLLDSSSYLGVAVQDRYHDTLRSLCRKWEMVAADFAAIGRAPGQAILLSLWLFTRCVELIESARVEIAAATNCSLDTLMQIGQVLAKRCPGWKARLHPRSRDYSIKVVSLVAWDTDHWALRGAEVIRVLLDAPQQLSSIEFAEAFGTVANVGKFHIQHFVWSLQLLRKCPVEDPTDLAAVEPYTSQQNTSALFRRLLSSFDSPKQTCPQPKRRSARVPCHNFEIAMPAEPQFNRRDVGAFMVAVHSRCRSMVPLLRHWRFAAATTSQAESHDLEVTYTEAEISEALTWCCFACNACMHEKWFVDRQARY